MVPRFAPGTVVTTTRMDTHYLATEYGVVNLMGKSTRERVRDIISLAHPKFREDLLSEAQKIEWFEERAVGGEQKIAIYAWLIRSTGLMVSPRLASAMARLITEVIEPHEPIAGKLSGLIPRNHFRDKVLRHGVTQDGGQGRPPRQACA